MDTTTPAQTPAPSATGEDKTVAIISYITLIGFIIAIVMHNGKKTKLGAFHLRQMLGLVLTGVALGGCGFILAFIPYIGRLAGIAIEVADLALLVLWIMGLISAINGQIKPLPVVGPLYQKWFGTAFD